MLHIFTPEADAGAVADAKASGHTESLKRRWVQRGKLAEKAPTQASPLRLIAINLVAHCQGITWAGGQNSQKSLTDERKSMAMTCCGGFM